MKKEKALEMLKILKKLYSKRTSLVYKNKIQLLVATILSAQCTDARVNIVTKELFKKYKNSKDFSKANLKTLQKEIYSTGFYKNKAKNIINSTKIITKKYNGKVPNTMEELTILPGVARKTANVVLSEGFNINEGIAIDTHVKRLSKRIGLTKHENPEKIEKDLMKIFPKKEWANSSILLIYHGRNICDSRKPKCLECKIKHLCKSAFKF